MTILFQVRVIGMCCCWSFRKNPIKMARLNIVSAQIFGNSINFVGDVYPLPNMTDIFDQLGKSKYYTTLDLTQEYHQVEIPPDQSEKTAFLQIKGL